MSSSDQLHHSRPSSPVSAHAQKRARITPRSKVIVEVPTLKSILSSRKRTEAASSLGHNSANDTTTQSTSTMLPCLPSITAYPSFQGRITSDPAEDTKTDTTTQTEPLNSDSESRPRTRAVDHDARASEQFLQGLQLHALEDHSSALSPESRLNSQHFYHHSTFEQNPSHSNHGISMAGSVQRAASDNSSDHNAYNSSQSPAPLSDRKLFSLPVYGYKQPSNSLLTDSNPDKLEGGHAPSPSAEDLIADEQNAETWDWFDDMGVWGAGAWNEGVQSAPLPYEGCLVASRLPPVNKLPATTTPGAMSMLTGYRNAASYDDDDDDLYDVPSFASHGSNEVLESEPESEELGELADLYPPGYIFESECSDSEDEWVPPDRSKSGHRRYFQEPHDTTDHDDLMPSPPWATLDDDIPDGNEHQVEEDALGELDEGDEFDEHSDESDELDPIQADYSKPRAPAYPKRRRMSDDEEEEEEGMEVSRGETTNATSSLLKDSSSKPLPRRHLATYPSPPRAISASSVLRQQRPSASSAVPRRSAGSTGLGKPMNLDSRKNQPDNKQNSSAKKKKNRKQSVPRGPSSSQATATSAAPALHPGLVRSSTNRRKLASRRPISVAKYKPVVPNYANDGPQIYPEEEEEEEEE